MFQSRAQAGQLLADEIKRQQIEADIVVGITRGGVVVAAEIAKHLNLPLEVVVVKKLGAPHNPELAIGAIANGVQYIDQKLAFSVGATKEYLKSEILQKRKDLKDRLQILNSIKSAFKLSQKRTILTDDGVATGATFFAAVLWLRRQKVKNIAAALPVTARSTATQIASKVDQTVILETPIDFRAVGQFYQAFPQVTDEEVVVLLKERY